MKADLYVQDHFYGSIDLPADGLLALLANGLIAQAETKAQQLKTDLATLDGVSCSITLHFRQPVTYETPDASPDPHKLAL